MIAEQTKAALQALFPEPVQVEEEAAGAIDEPAATEELQEGVEAKPAKKRPFPAPTAWSNGTTGSMATT